MEIGWKYIMLRGFFTLYRYFGKKKLLKIKLLEFFGKKNY